jgi:hypothetical protein
MPAGFTSSSEAWKFLEQTSALEPNPYEPPEERLPKILRAAKRAAHPDTGGNAELFQRVNLAEQYLKQNGALS